MSSNLLKRLESEILIIDGAMGTILQSLDLVRPEDCIDHLCLTHKQEVKEIHKSYVDAGADIILTNTFGANRAKLSNYGLESEVENINRTAVEIIRSIGDIFVVGNVGPTGMLVKRNFDELYEIFYEQIKALGEAGVDAYSIETFSHIQEIRAAVIAAKEYNRISGKDIPIFAQMTFEDMGRTTFGTDPITAAVILDSLGVDVIGTNCGLGPEQMFDVANKILENTNKYVIVQPNAGLPEIIDGQTVFHPNTNEFLNYSIGFAKSGANIIGGCCGTTPEHIKAIAEHVKQLKPLKRNVISRSRVSSYCKTVDISKGMIIDEGPNVNKSRIKREIRDGNLSRLIRRGIQQEKIGADILDINVSVPGTDEPLNMERLVTELSQVVSIPFMLDSSDPKALEKGLRAYPGKAIINSTTASTDKMKIIFELAKKYGAAVLGLTMDTHVPDNPNERLELAKRIIDFGSDYIPVEDIYIDCIVTSLNSDPLAAKKTLESLRKIKQLECKTILGASNISSGMPARRYVNKIFLDLAFSAGLNAGIFNHNYSNIEVPSKNKALIEKMLLGDTSSFEEFNNIFSDFKFPVVKNDQSAEEKLGIAIINGDKANIGEYVNKCLETYKAEEILKRFMLPAMDEVGELSNQGKIYLPHLLATAEAMNTAIKILEPYLDGSELGENIVLATVKGDHHDIGKNLVGIILKCYRYNVVDLGKDVSAQSIVDQAIEAEADYIGLSALMTTTMAKMPEVIELARQRDLNIPVIIGGAPVDNEYAQSIGAYYAKNPIALIALLKGIQTMNEVGL